MIHGRRSVGPISSVPRRARAAISFAYFQRNAITPLVVGYEDLTQEPEDVAGRILRHLRLPLPACLPSSLWQHQRHADSLSDEWVRRYEALKPRAI
jgi:LPS sulfotransferase NodH